LVFLVVPQSAQADECGTDPSGFDAWKATFATEARAKGIGPNGIAALKATTYSVGTILADRGQKSFRLSLPEFLSKRGAATIVAKGRRLKVTNAALFSSILREYGVPPGPLLAIWGMETGFGTFMGNQNTLSAVATLTYDCRRPSYFAEHLYAALQLIDNGTLAPDAIGAMHGEVGHTQFLPKNILLYGADEDNDGKIDLNNKADALASTARFFQAQGWIVGAGYQRDEPNFSALQKWNAAEVYQQAIALIGRQIDGR
jgi:membrane-bound lytic murein transglycosylase B